MIRFIAILTLLVISCSSFGGITIVMKGYWTPVCDGLAISKHNRYDKALSAAINQNTDCDILPPDRFELRRETLKQKDIVIYWRLPTEREDGTALTKIDRFNVYYYLNGAFQNIDEVKGDSVMYTLADVSPGDYVFQISTVSEGVEGNKSNDFQIQVID